MAINEIHGYARLGKLKELKMAVAAGAEIDRRNSFGSTALQCAIAEKQLAAVDLLLDLGADVMAQDANGATALHYAIEHKLRNVLELLLQRCPNAINVSDKHGNQPLWTAAFTAGGDYEMVSMLLRCGADPEHRNNVNLSTMDIPKRKGDPVLLGLLEKR